jgi:sec-independent protein translocase protein TatA
MFFGHAPELIIVLVVALLIFGPKRLPEMGAGVGKFIKEFRKSINEISNHTDVNSDIVKSPSLEAIERENASRNTANELLKNNPVGNPEMAVKTPGSETSPIETRID